MSKRITKETLDTVRIMLEALPGLDSPVATGALVAGHVRYYGHPIPYSSVTRRLRSCIKQGLITRSGTPTGPARWTLTPAGLELAQGVKPTVEDVCLMGPPEPAVTVVGTPEVCQECQVSVSLASAPEADPVEGCDDCGAAPQEYCDPTCPRVDSNPDPDPEPREETISAGRARVLGLL